MSLADLLHDHQLMRLLKVAACVVIPAAIILAIITIDRAR